MGRFKVLKAAMGRKTNPIPRDRDNTDDIEANVMRAHSRYKGLQAPEGTSNRPISGAPAGTKVSSYPSGGAFSTPNPSTINTTRTAP